MLTPDTGFWEKKKKKVLTGHVHALLFVFLWSRAKLAFTYQLTEMLPVVALVNVLWTLLWLSSGGITVAPVKQTVMESIGRSCVLNSWKHVFMSHKVVMFVLCILYLCNTSQDCYWVLSQHMYTLFCLFVVVYNVKMSIWRPLKLCSSQILAKI